MHGRSALRARLIALTFVGGISLIAALIVLTLPVPIISSTVPSMSLILRLDGTTGAGASTLSPALDFFLLPVVEHGCVVVLSAICFIFIYFK
jgi:hypothetical protein